ncbi:MAG TPA: DUF1573 domain-containing protein [Thermoanaerobaculia bacterium]|nr:DUF1573 domain-containing protein [Thermoanaerobaculia bacterium]
MNRHMKTVNLALCCVLLAAATLLAQGATGKPKAVAVEPIKDVGFVAKGEMAIHEFVIRNDGDALLELREVRAACGCTVADFDKTIAPGKTGKVRVTLDTGTFNGPIAKGVTVYTNDPEVPTIELTVRTDVGQFVKVKPGYARFIMVQGEKEGKIVQTLWTPDKTPLEIVKVESPYPFLKLRFWEAKPEERLTENADQQQWKVEAVLASDAPVGALTEPVRIHTTHPKQKLVQIPVSGFVRPVMAVTPPVVDIGQVDGKVPVRFSLNVRNFATEPIKVTGVAGDVQGIDAKIEPLQEGREYQVQITFQPDARKGPVNGKLTLTTDSQKVPRIEVQLKGIVI